MEPPPLRVSLLGAFVLRCGADVLPIHAGRVCELVAFIALRPDQPHARPRVAGALWPESSESQARTNLRNLVHQLRRAFPEIDRYLDTAGTGLAWRPGAPVSVDVVAFEAALDAALAGVRGRAGCAALEAALALYTGPLLPERYDAWLVPEQERIQRLYRRGLEALLDCQLEAGDFARAREVSEVILDQDRLSEHAHQGRIRALVGAGDRAAALRAYEECAAILEAELGVGPGAATVAELRAALGAAGSARSVLASDEPEGIPLHGEAPLVGRAREQASLRGARSRVLEEKRSRMVWVAGEPGIGKTRLVQWFADWLRRQGEPTAEAQAYPTQGALAYGPIIEWLRSPLLASALAAVPPSTRTELRRLLPELRGADAAIPTSAERRTSAAAEEGGPPPLTEAERRQRLHDATIAVLAGADAPSTFVLDDLQWSDRETIDLLNTLVLRASRPLLIVATVRTGETGPEHPLAASGARLLGADRLDRIQLKPLDLDDTGTLVRALVDEDIPDDEVRGLHRETEGNPLFIVETARMGRSWSSTGGDAASPGASPPRIRAVIETRLGLLSPDARLVTSIASAIGREFALSLLLAASPLDEERTVRGLDEAWRRMLVRERGGERYDFSHGKIREVAYRTTSPIRRRGYHQRLAGALEASLAGGSLGPPDTTLDQIALHYDHGGSVSDAVAWYRRAADAALDVSGPDAARQLLDRALELVERLPPSAERDRMELDMRLKQGSVLVALEGYGRPSTLETYEAARDLCLRLGRPVTSPVLRALALASLARGDLDEGAALGRELSRAADRDDDDLARAEGAYVTGVMAFWQGHLEESRRHLEDAVASYRPELHREHLLLYAQDPKVVCLSRLAWALWLLGRVPAAQGRRDEALALADRQGDPMTLAYALWFTAFIAVDQGDISRLTIQAERMREVAGAHRLLYSESVAEGLLGYIDTVQGDVRGGIARMRATLADRRWKGMEYILKAQTLFLVARAAASAGDSRSGREAVREALDFLGPGPSVWKAPFLHVDARLVGLGDRTGDAALPAFRRALEAARDCGSAWTELGVALDRGRWLLERRAGDTASAVADLERALAAYQDARFLPAVAAAEIVRERLDPEGRP